jgi:hypothetical protein
MSVYAKLMAARIELHALNIKKSGYNKFAGYSYMELSDFLIPTQQIFAKLTLCGVVSFTKDVASLTITDIEDKSQIVITSPMGSAALKGCHEVQQIGAVETYQRRYLWVAALEIVEHDALDGSPAVEEKTMDVTAILAGIANSSSLDILLTNFNNAMSMLAEDVHPAIKAAVSKRKAELSQKDN